MPEQPIILNITDIYSINYNKQFILEVFITDSCNLQCIYCINLNLFNKRYNLFLDLKQLYKFIIFIEKYYNKYISIIFIGGEPTLHPDLLWFCEKISNKEKINLLIYTNFELGLNFFLKFKNFKNIFFKISFHYINLNKTKLFLEKLQNCLINNINIDEIIVMVTHDNYDICINTYKQIKKYFYNTGCSLLLKTSNYIPKYSKEQIDKCNIIINNQQLNKDIIVNNNKHINHFELVNNFNFYHWLCGAKKYQIFIDLHGNIFPCQHIKIKLSTIFDYKLIKLQNTICTYKGICTDEISYRKKIFK